MKQVNVILVEIAQLHQLTYQLNNTGFKRYNHNNKQQKYIMFPIKYEIYNNYSRLEP
jgi:hypothetical protein